MVTCQRLGWRFAHDSTPEGKNVICSREASTRRMTLVRFHWRNEYVCAPLTFSGVSGGSEASDGMIAWILGGSVATSLPLDAALIKAAILRRVSCCWAKSARCSFSLRHHSCHSFRHRRSNRLRSLSTASLDCLEHGTDVVTGIRYCHNKQSHLLVTPKFHFHWGSCLCSARRSSSVLTNSRRRCSAHTAARHARQALSCRFQSQRAVAFPKRSLRSNTTEYHPEKCLCRH